MQYTAVPIDYVVPLAGDQQLRQAAALAINGTTAHAVINEAANVQPG
jgi:NADPH:quinone reductase-like Zn-dependent oxidoreductase